jgi:archaellum component FlaC
MQRTDVSLKKVTYILASQGKLSRQIANLKQTLKHTTENTMQLDTTIEQRKREITNISQDINNERDYNEQYRNDLKRS